MVAATVAAAVTGVKMRPGQTGHDKDKLCYTKQIEEAQLLL